MDRIRLDCSIWLNITREILLRTSLLRLFYIPTESQKCNPPDHYFLVSKIYIVINKGHGELRIDYCDKRPFWESYYIYGTISVTNMYDISYEAPDFSLSFHMNEIII